MAGYVKDTDRGFRNLIRALGKDKELVLTVGVHGPEGGVPAEGDSRLTVTEVATIHEYGLGVPERSFIRGWADETRTENEDNLRKIAEAVVKGKFDLRTGLERYGLRCVGSVQRRISGNIPPPLAQVTIDRKGSSVALIDTGQLRSSIRHQVRHKSEVPDDGGEK